MQVYPKSYCIQHKTKRYSFHSCRLMFIFCQHRQHDCHMAFSLLESVHRIAPPVQTIPTSQTHPENCYISCKTKAAGLPPYRLMFIFSNADGTAATWRFLYSNLCIELFRQYRQFQPCKPIRKAATSTKSKAVQFSPIPLDVYFFQRRRHDCRRAFSLPESVHRIAPPASSLFGKLLHPRKAKRYSFHPYRLMFIFSQHRRHGCHMAFSLLEFVRRIAPPMRTHEK